MIIKRCFPLLLLVVLVACKKNNDEFFVDEDPSTFSEIGSIDIGDVGAAEITTYDPITKRLFVVNNGIVNKIDVIDFSNPTSMSVITFISMAPYGGAVNSLSVHNGVLAAAIESLNKQDNGKVALFNTNTLAEIKVVTVGALPDMITFSPDGKYILTANEGEPSANYSNDPAGTVSIIEVNNNYAVTTIDFSAFASQEATLKSGGLRVFGIGKNFVKDMEPEYITVSGDSKTAWVALQENNAIAKINIASKTVINIFPLGFKNYNTDENAIDPSDSDGSIGLFAKWPVKGIYMPDAIAILEKDGIPHLFTVNEGDAREYDALTEAKRVKSLTLDPTAFPDATIKTDAKLGRLNVTTTLGDTDNDGDYDELYSFGARSFSVWNGNTGALLFDSKNELDKKIKEAGWYDDGRSDDKSVEPEGIAIGKVGNKQVAFVGMERSDALAIYDITNPLAPVFLKMLTSGDAPEGVLFIPAKDSPLKKSLLVVSSENDGVIKVYRPS